jgi:hypothetical protein
MLSIPAVLAMPWNVCLSHPPCVQTQELDEAARRRMPKQLFIPLPCEAARRKMLEKVFVPGGRF